MAKKGDTGNVVFSAKSGRVSMVAGWFRATASGGFQEGCFC